MVDRKNMTTGEFSLEDVYAIHVIVLPACTVVAMTALPSLPGW